MSDHPKRTLPPAPSLTHLKQEAKALRASFDAGDSDIRDRVATHIDPLPPRLAQTQALFVVSREYGFTSWPVLKRSVERRTRTVFADVEGVGTALADLLGAASVSVADTLESAFDSDAEVLVLYLDARRSDRLPAATVAALRNRKLVLTGSGADWLCGVLDLEIGGGMGSEVQPLEVVDNVLLAGEWTQRSIEPLLHPPAPHSYELRKDQRHLVWRPVPDELRVARGAGFVDVIARLKKEDASAVVASQANCVFAGVIAPPDNWSTAYRELFRHVVARLAERELVEFELAAVSRDVQPPGTVNFDLDSLRPDTSRRADPAHRRQFYFQFDRETVLTATLRHNGSSAATLYFGGGRQGHGGTAEYAEHGETLTIAVTLRQAAIDAMAGRYWTLGVVNFDRVRALSAELTVRYDALEGGEIRPLPSNASFEHFHWLAERSEAGDAAARLLATAQTFGFDDWKALQNHVAWSEPELPKDGNNMRDRYLFQAQAKFGESFGLKELMEFMSAQTKFTEDLRHAIMSACADAEARNHGFVVIEHLLIALLDNPVTDDVLTKCGADRARLRDDLQTSLGSVPGGKAQISRELFGVLCRAGFYTALGRERCNAANVLVGMFTEPCRAHWLLEEQGIHRDDVIRYLAHGIPKSLPSPHRSSGILDASVEAILHTAFAQATDRRHEAVGVEHVLLALVDTPEIVEHLASPAERDRLRSELDAFVATTPTAAVGAPRPTRALNRSLQLAVAWTQRKRDGAADVDSLIRAIATEHGTLAADVLSRHGGAKL